MNRFSSRLFSTLSKLPMLHNILAQVYKLNIKVWFLSDSYTKKYRFSHPLAIFVKLFDTWPIVACFSWPTLVLSSWLNSSTKDTTIGLYRSSSSKVNWASRLPTSEASLKIMKSWKKIFRINSIFILIFRFFQLFHSIRNGRCIGGFLFLVITFDEAGQNWWSPFENFLFSSV